MAAKKIDFKSINRHRGDFTKKANSAGMGVQAYARHVLANKGRYDTRTVRQASFAKAAKKFKSHALGGSFYMPYLTPYFYAAPNRYAGVNDVPEINPVAVGNVVENEPYTSGYEKLKAEDKRFKIINPALYSENESILRGMGLSDKKIAAINTAFLDERPKGELQPYYFYWMKDAEGNQMYNSDGSKRMFYSSTKKEGLKPFLMNVGAYSFTDNSEVNYATDFLDWCRDNSLDPNSLYASDLYLINVYIPIKLAESEAFRKVWEDEDATIEDYTRVLLKYGLAGDKRNDEVWLNERAGDAVKIYEARSPLYDEEDMTDETVSPESDANMAVRDRTAVKKPTLADEVIAPKINVFPQGYPVQGADALAGYAPQGYPVQGADALAGYAPPFSIDLAGYEPEVDYTRPYAAGGELAHSHGAWWPNGMQYVNSGGTHEQNPNMGVQVGVDGQGTPNLVEEGEVIYDDYVFSNRLYPTRKELEEANLPVSYAKKTFAYIAERMGRESEERPNDAISRRGLEAMLQRLAGIQERQRQERGLVGTQHMEQGAGMPQSQEDIPQGMSPQDMAAMRQMGGGQIPPEMLAQMMAGGAGYGQPGEYAQEGPDVAEQGYGEEAYAAYGGHFGRMFGKGGDKKKKFTSERIESYDADYFRTAKGTRGVSSFPQSRFDKVYKRRYNNALISLAGHSNLLARNVNTYDEMLHALYGSPRPKIVEPAEAEWPKDEDDTLNGGMLEESVVSSDAFNNRYYKANKSLKETSGDDGDYPLLDPGVLNGSLMKPRWGRGTVRAKTRKQAKIDAVYDALGWVREQIDKGANGENEEAPPLIKAYGGNMYSGIDYSFMDALSPIDDAAAYYTTQAIRMLDPDEGNYRDKTIKSREKEEKVNEKEANRIKRRTDRFLKRNITSSTGVRYPSLPTTGAFEGWDDEKRLGASKFLANAYDPENINFYSTLTDEEKDALQDWMANNAIKGPDLLPVNMRYASAMGPAVSALVNAFRRPDKSEARAYESVAANVPNVSVRPRMLSSYMPYSPLSREYALNTVRSQAGATRRANVGLNAGQANALNLALNYQAVPQMGQALANTDARNLERMKAVYDFNRQTDMTNAQNDLAAQNANAQNALQRYSLVSSLRSKAAEALSKERSDLEEARMKSLSGLFTNLGAIGKENLAYNQAVSTSQDYGYGSFGDVSFRNPYGNAYNIGLTPPTKSTTVSESQGSKWGGMLTRSVKTNRSRR